MGIPISQVDAFTDRPFSGNPAAVCLLPEARDAAWMQNVAAEMNLSETAFLVRKNGGYDLRWFTPKLEVDLCGHATLASAHVLWQQGKATSNEIRFSTRSGILTALNRQGEIELDFPLEPGDESFLARKRRRQHLDRHFLAGLGMVGKVHRAHPAAADSMFDDIGSDAFRVHRKICL